MGQSAKLSSRPVPLVRSRRRDTFIENEPQTGFFEKPTLQSTRTISAKKARPRPHADDDLYNVTNDESVEVPLICSNSVKKRAENAPRKYPPLQIPSPSAWPMPPSVKSALLDTRDSPISGITPSTARNAALNARQHTRVPSRSSTPDLDGSITSEEMVISTGPTTPASRSGSPKAEDWKAPAQLDPEVFAILNHIAPSTNGSDSGSVSHHSADAIRSMTEMREIFAETPTHHRLQPGDTLMIPTPIVAGSDVASPLTVPSPGGFFASLERTARQTWCVTTSPAPSTGTAERFYGVPWRGTPRQQSATAEDVPSAAGQSQDTSQTLTAAAEVFYGVPFRQPSPSRLQGLRLDTQHAVNQDIIAQHTARKESIFSPIDGLEVTEMTDENAIAFASATPLEPQLERTKRWLYSQYAWIQALTSELPKTPTAAEMKLKSCFSPDTPSTPGNVRPSPSSATTEDSPAKKSVRFLEKIPENGEVDLSEASLRVEPLFHQGWKYMASRARLMDAFVNAQSRAEAQHVAARNFPGQHRAQLEARFRVEEVDRPIQHRPISALVPIPPDEERNAVLAAAERERQVLEQIAPSIWELQAARHIFGAQLVVSPAIATLRTKPGALVLDFGGQADCDWGWAVAVQFRSATVITMPPFEDIDLGEEKSDDEPVPILEGPPNHRVVPLPSGTEKWRLPFPDAHFDLISARTLHVLLRTTYPLPITHPYRDEWDVMLAEFDRVLKPGGYLEFNLLDAELLHPAGPAGQALSVEFAFVLRQRGYEAQATRFFLPRLRRAGFVDVKRAWLVLPCADVVPRWVDRGKTSSATSPAKRHGRQDSAVSCRSNSGGRDDGGDNDDGFEDGMRFFSVPCHGSATVGNVSGAGPDRTYQRPVVGSLKHVRAMTGLVGTRGWERWILRLQREVGADEDKMLCRINRALEEGGKGKTGWRCLMGWGRKADGH